MALAEHRERSPETRACKKPNELQAGLEEAS